MSEPATRHEIGGERCPADRRRVFLEGVDRGERVAVAFEIDDQDGDGFRGAAGGGRDHAGFRGAVDDVSISPVSDRLAGIVVDGDAGRRWRIMYWGAVGEYVRRRDSWISAGRRAEVAREGGRD